VSIVKTIFKRIILVSWALYATVDSLAAPVIPTGQLEYDFIYERIERLQTLDGGLLIIK